MPRDSSSESEALRSAEPQALEPSPAPDQRAWRMREVGLAIKNALKLGGSLLFTWSIGLVLRLYIPRYLGPDRFGVLNFADAFAGTAFVLLDLGITTYVRKQIAVRPQHASDFVGGVLVFRLGLVLLLYLGMEIILRVTGRSEEVRQLVYIFGIAQFFVVGANMSSALLQASGNVNEMSVMSIVTKVVWAIGIVVALALELGLWAYAVALCVSEGLKSFTLFLFARKHLDLKIRFDFKATRLAILGGMPFYVSGVASTIYNRIDVTMLGVMTSDREVGWYGAAVGLASVTMLLAPLISWVLIPLFSRAAKESEEELSSLSRRSLELILTLAIAVSFGMVVGADVLVTFVFGTVYAPATLAMQILTVAHVLMYVSVVYWITLTMYNITWRVTAIFLVGLCINPTLNYFLIRPGIELMGHGGGGAAAATATLITEVCIVGMLAYMLGRRGMDKRLALVIAKNFGLAVLIVWVDAMFLRSLGPARLLIDAALFVTLALVTGAVDVREKLQWIRDIMRQRREAKA